MVFFKIGAFDVTPYVDIQNFKMNQRDVYTSWVDGNGIEHRDVTRQCIEGKVMVGFRNTSDLNSFRSALTSNRQTGGYYPLTAYLQNTAETVTFNGFIEMEAQSKFDIKNSHFWKEITISVKER